MVKESEARIVASVVAASAAATAAASAASAAPAAAGAQARKSMAEEDDITDMRVFAIRHDI